MSPAAHLYKIKNMFCHWDKTHFRGSTEAPHEVQRSSSSLLGLIVNITCCKACDHGHVYHGAVRADCGVDIHMPTHANPDILNRARRHAQAAEDVLCHECEETPWSIQRWIYVSRHLMSSASCAKSVSCEDRRQKPKATWGGFYASSAYIATSGCSIGSPKRPAHSPPA